VFKKKPFRFHLIGSVLLYCSLLCATSLAANSTAKALFDEVQDRVYQVRVIDVASGDKYSIGSGFLVSDTGYIATNFHVVSSFVHEPEKYRLEYVRHDGSVGPLRLMATDVVHDLALVFSGDAPATFLPLATDPLANGDRIYSMGNPHDLGMTIIEGTYNGLVENSRYKKILFSGSLNPGMSGGPALNTDGAVIGINVSKGGEQISFLVPVAHLENLLAENNAMPVERDHASEITAALLFEQQQFYQDLIRSPATSKLMGKLSVPGKKLKHLRCWGHTSNEEKNKYEATHQHCKSEDEIYVSDDIYVGSFYYDFELISTQELNRFQFYHFLEERFTHRPFSNTQDKEQVTDFRCHDNIIEMNATSWKISTCFRAYKQHEGLFDASLTMVSLDQSDLAAVVKIGATGISSNNAIAIFQHIVGAVSWTN
jgi:serine protease Do